MSRNIYSNFWFIRSHSDPEIFYKVSERVSGGYACSCKHWIFRNHGDPDFRCKHIDEVLAGRFTYEAAGAVRALMLELEEVAVGARATARRIVDPLSPLEAAVVNQEVALAQKKAKRAIIM